MTRITRQKGSLAHDDRLDVLAIAVNYWVEQMAQNADDKIKSRKDQMMDRELEKFMEHTVGRKPKGNTWI